MQSKLGFHAVIYTLQVSDIANIRTNYAVWLTMSVFQ